MIRETLMVQEDDSGDAFVELPPEVLEKLGWNECTPISMLQEGDRIVIKEKTVWELREFKEHIDMILDDIKVNKTKHTITDNGHFFFKIG